MISDTALNSAQNQASKVHDGPLLVVAGAGTGKTRTLVYRLARLIENGVSPESILLLTFTRRASQEMIHRSSELVGGELRKVSGGTFHSFASLMIRRFGRYIGIPNDFTVLDQSDCLEIIGHLRSEMNLGDKKRRFPRRETIAAILSKVTNLQLSIEEILETKYEHLSHELPAIEKINIAYHEYKADRQLLDFDDLLTQLVRLFRESKEAKERICSLYPYVMVDEYQDTNLLQAILTRELAGNQENIMVVGDDAQSIYAFRGASFENLFEFQQTFRDVTVVALEENYRSTQPILDFSNAILNSMAKSFRKKLYTSRTDGCKPHIVETRGEKEQAQFIVREIRRLN